MECSEGCMETPLIRTARRVKVGVDAASGAQAMRWWNSNELLQHKTYHVHASNHFGRVALARRVPLNRGLCRPWCSCGARFRNENRRGSNHLTPRNFRKQGDWCRVGELVTLQASS